MVNQGYKCEARRKISLTSRLEELDLAISGRRARSATGRELLFLRDRGPEAAVAPLHDVPSGHGLIEHPPREASADVLIGCAIALVAEEFVDEIEVLGTDILHRAAD